MKHTRLKLLLVLTGALALTAAAILVPADRNSIKYRFRIDSPGFCEIDMPADREKWQVLLETPL